MSFNLPPDYFLPLFTFALGFWSRHRIQKYLPAKQYNPHYLSTQEVPHSWIQNKKQIYTKITKISDSDNLRVSFIATNYPAYLIYKLRFLLTGPAFYKTNHKEETIHIRLMGIDAPESAAFGMPEQKYNKEAKEFLVNQYMNKYAKVKVLRRDQYHRIIGSVQILPFKTNISIAMVKAGWACVYQQANAEHDGQKSLLLSLEKKAKIKKIGMWQNGGRDILLPSEHKKKYL